MMERFAHPTYLIRRKVLQLLGASFHIYDPVGELVLYGRMKAFKLKEDLRIYTDETMQTEVLIIRARQFLDFSATYDVIDAAAGTRVGALRRKGLKSMLKDEWLFLDEADREIGLISEDSVLMALVRRFVANIIPQTYQGVIGDAPVCSFRQNWNPFVTKITVDFTPDTGGQLDRRLGIAAAILLCIVEGKQG